MKRGTSSTAKVRGHGVRYLPRLENGRWISVPIEARKKGPVSSPEPTGPETAQGLRRIGMRYLIRGGLFNKLGTRITGQKTLRSSGTPSESKVSAGLPG